MKASRIGASLLLSVPLLSFYSLYNTQSAHLIVCSQPVLTPSCWLKTLDPSSSDPLFARTQSSIRSQCGVPRNPHEHQRVLPDAAIILVVAEQVLVRVLADQRRENVGNGGDD